MIYEALMVPTESAPTLREIKRALLTYDKVFLIDPGDRDLIPGTAWLQVAFPMPVPFAMDYGPVRPMGKVIGYDDQFQRTFELCRVAREQDLIQLRSTYQRLEPSLEIGPDAGLSDYPLDTRDVFWFYRHIAGSQDFLRSAIGSQARALIAELEVNPGLACQGLADGHMSHAPDLPLIDDNSLGTNALALSQIARARLGALIKYSGMCEQRNMVPVLPSDVYGGLTELVLREASDALLTIDEDRFWAKRGRVLNLCHEEFLVDEALDQLSVEEVIERRTKVWGKQAEAREQLFEAVHAIASEAELDQDFDSRVHARIAEYRKLSDDLVKERAGLNSWIKCTLAEGALGGVVALGAGLERLVQAPLVSVATTLALAGVWVSKRRKEYLPKQQTLQQMENNMRRNRGAAFGLHNFYSRFK